MPDLDIFNPISPGWHKPYKLVLGRAEPAEIGRAALKALSRSLRRGHGLEALSELARVARGAIHGNLSAPDALNRLHAIECTSGGDRHTKVAVQTVVRIIADARDGPILINDLESRIAIGFCKDLLVHHLYGPAWTEVSQKRFPASADARAFGDAVATVVEPGVTKLGEALARNPKAVSLRAPIIGTASRRTTVDLLGETIEVIGGVQIGRFHGCESSRLPN